MQAADDDNDGDEDDDEGTFVEHLRVLLSV